jgi:hypothetical protein
VQRVDEHDAAHVPRLTYSWATASQRSATVVFDAIG